MPPPRHRLIHYVKYNKVAFLCNGTDRHKIPAKNANRCAVSNLNRTLSKIFPYGGDFASKQPFWESFWPASVLHTYRSPVTFLDFAKPSIYWMKGQRCSHPESTFVSGGRSTLKIAKFRQANDNENILVTDLQVMPHVFSSKLRIRCCPFERSFLYHLSFRRYLSSVLWRCWLGGRASGL